MWVRSKLGGQRSRNGLTVCTLNASLCELGHACRYMLVVGVKAESLKQRPAKLQQLRWDIEVVRAPPENV